MTPPDRRIARGRRCTSLLYNHTPAPARARVYATQPRVCGHPGHRGVVLAVHDRVRCFVEPSRQTQAAPTAPSTSLIESDGKSPVTPASTSTTTTELLPKEENSAIGSDPPSCTSPATAISVAMPGQVDETDRDG